MPDNEDYTALGDLLARPRTWTAAETATMRTYLCGSRESLAALHPLDHRGRARLLEVVAQLTEAIRIADSAAE